MAYEVKKPPVQGRLTEKQKDNLHAKIEILATGEWRWLASCESKGAPVFRLGDVIAAAPVVWFDTYGWWPIGNLVRECDHGERCVNPMCRRDAGADPLIYTPKRNSKKSPENKAIFTALREAGISVQIGRPDEVGATRDMVCYHHDDTFSDACASEKLRRKVHKDLTEQMRVLEDFDGEVTTDEVRTFNPVEARNDVLCESAYDDEVKLTKGSHLLAKKGGHGLVTETPLIDNTVEARLVTAIDNNIPVELVVSCTDLSDIVVEEFLEERPARPLLLNLNRKEDITQGCVVPVPVGWEGMAPEAQARFNAAFERLRKYPLNFTNRKKKLTKHEQRHTGSAAAVEVEREVVTYPDDWMPKRLTADEALALSLELSKGRKPMPEPPAVIFTDFTPEILVGAACHHCGEWIDLNEYSAEPNGYRPGQPHTCFSGYGKRKYAKRDAAFWLALEEEAING